MSGWSHSSHDQAFAVGAPAGRGDEVGTGDDDLGLARLVRRQAHDRVDGLGPLGVALLDAQDRRAVGRHVAVGVAQAARHLGHRGQGDRLAAVRTDAVEALRRPVGEPQHAVACPPRTAAVLVHRRPCVPRRGEHLGDRAVRRSAQHGVAPTLLGAALRPPDVGAVERHVAGRPRRPHHELARDRCRPGTVGQRRHGTEGTPGSGRITGHDDGSRHERHLRAPLRDVRRPCRPDALLVNGLGSQCINYKVEWCEMFAPEGFRSSASTTATSASRRRLDGARTPATASRHGRRRVRRSRRPRRRAGPRRWVCRWAG